jgi:5-methylcytosine-specific restriction endonuclease McrA
MNNKKPNAALLWRELEDVVVPALRLSPVDRVVYAHLLRHTVLEGKTRLRFSMAWLGRGTNLCTSAVRPAVRRLVMRGALRLVDRSRAGHVVEVRSPKEIRATRVHQVSAMPRGHAFAPKYSDFSRTRKLREAIHCRERSLCFYCLRQVSRLRRCLDHVVPLARGGGNSYRNLVSCCTECNARKGEMAAKDFLRLLYREERLSGSDLAGRLRAVDALAADKLRPVLPTVQLRAAWR